LKFKAEGFRSQTADDFNIPSYIKIIGLGNVRKMKSIKNNTILIKQSLKNQNRLFFTFPDKKKGIRVIV
jgi:hypothetical protein